MKHRHLGPFPTPTQSMFLLFVLASLQGCDDKPSHDNSLENYIDSNRTHGTSGYHTVIPYTSSSSTSAHSTGFFSSTSAHASSSSAGS